MLIIKAYVNSKQIEEIHIQNTGNCVDENMQLYEYRIRLPEGYDDFPIFHMRELGWRALATQAIGVLEQVMPRKRKKEKKKDFWICGDCGAQKPDCVCRG